MKARETAQAECHNSCTTSISSPVGAEALLAYYGSSRGLQKLAQVALLSVFGKELPFLF